MLEHRQVGHIFKRVRCLDIYVQSTDFILFFQSTDFNVSNQFLFFPKKKKKMGKKSPQRCAGISLQSLQFFVSGLELGVQ